MSSAALGAGRRREPLPLRRRGARLLCGGRGGRRQARGAAQLRGQWAAGGLCPLRAAAGALAR